MLYEDQMSPMRRVMQSLRKPGRTCLRHHYCIDAPVTPIEERNKAKKRQRDEDGQGSAPPALRRPVAPLLSARYADLEVAKCRLYGFSMS